ncbi:lysophospholipid acyltransferase family protein [Arcicella lustrica]|uniref:Lysophospholipid acyltransferase family protein n=1 Tax=Arcicella lustrica TaxID=2984196 RepID=A0ABU5SEL3_9BACT|nr:lysophospholipid acyltransferase family protein [Arcicella sp. DC25W]MEA5425723.1 lysophospholipid acyltransferase family protein [Arcicella sp. DC25W]
MADFTIFAFMRILRFLYTAWAIFWFVSLFLILFPFFWLFLQKETWKPKAHYLNRLWGKLYFPIIGMPINIKYEAEIDVNKTYVFCANHFSYLDIAVMGLVIKNYYAFVGKAGLKKVPLFGYMFRKLHIQVDRNDKHSRSVSLTRSLKALKNGRSIIIFPEGGIKAKHPPKLHLPLKDGGFVMAINQQIPIVPITFLNNFQILEDGEYLLKPKAVKVIVHKPIETKGMTSNDVEALKEKFKEVVQGTLDITHQTQSIFQESIS